MRIVWKILTENALQQRLINVAIKNQGQKRQLRSKCVQTYANIVELYTPTSERKHMKEHRHIVHKYIHSFIHTYANINTYVLCTQICLCAYIYLYLPLWWK